ncbi:hypothetical protein HanIR_Chr12g0584931 [Helianthus annuus]|nr:hypothetical protein HanIR_Chr12g0584931 [Helianthus annuus]
MGCFVFLDLLCQEIPLAMSIRTHGRTSRPLFSLFLLSLSQILRPISATSIQERPPDVPLEMILYRLCHSTRSLKIYTKYI